MRACPNHALRHHDAPSMASRQEARRPCASKIGRRVVAPFDGIERHRSPASAAREARHQGDERARRAGAAHQQLSAKPNQEPSAFVGATRRPFKSEETNLLFGSADVLSLR